MKLFYIVLIFTIVQEAAKEALKLDRTPLKGRPMFISRCDPNKDTRDSGFKFNSTLEKKKLFVRGIQKFYANCTIYNKLQLQNCFLHIITICYFVY